MTVETCPQYLLLSTDDGARLGPNFLRVKPPVREPGHNEPLWAACSTAPSIIISTDHAPHLREEKLRPSIWDCAPGFPGVETSMRFDADRGFARASHVAAILSGWPAPRRPRRFGLYPRKGVLAEGADADIVLVDMK